MDWRAPGPPPLSRVALGPVERRRPARLPRRRTWADLLSSLRRRSATVRRPRDGRSTAGGLSEMRILWVKVGGLWPLNTGGRLRTFHMISELARRHRVTLLTTHRPGENPHELAARLSRCERVVSFPHDAAKYDSTRFALALLRSWLSPLPVDLWK